MNFNKDFKYQMSSQFVDIDLRYYVQTDRRTGFANAITVCFIKSHRPVIFLSNFMNISRHKQIVYFDLKLKSVIRKFQLMFTFYRE